MKKILAFISILAVLLLGQNKYDPKVILKEQIKDAKENPVIDSDTLNKDTTKSWQAVDTLVKLPVQTTKQQKFDYKLIIIPVGIVSVVILIILLWSYLATRKSRKTLRTIEYIRDGRIVPEYNKQLIKFRKKLSDSNLIESDNKEELQQTAKNIGITLGELELASKIKKLKKKKKK